MNARSPIQGTFPAEPAAEPAMVCSPVPLDGGSRPRMAHSRQFRNGGRNGRFRGISVSPFQDLFAPGSPREYPRQEYA